MKNPWKQLSSEIVYQNKFGYKVRVDQVITPGKTRGEYLVIEQNGYVIVVAINQNGEIILERQWRYPIEEESLEIPAGHVDSNNEDPLEAAKRELFEETGGKSKNWYKLGTHWLGNGVLKIKGHAFLATQVKLNTNSHQEDDEKIAVEFMDFKQALESVINNRFQDYRTKLGILLANEFIKRNKIKL